jgi:isopenicillin N synthase-like dioxygenase
MDAIAEQAGPPAAGNPVPGIDAAALRRAPEQDGALLQQIRDAASERGYLLLDNAFADSDADLRLLEVMRHFFALPADDPRKQAIDVSKRDIKYGWMPLFGEPAYQAGTRARVESFDCGRPRRGTDDPGYHSVWPAISGFEEAVREVWHELTDCGFAVLDALAAATGLPAGFLRERCADQDSSTMRLLHYPGQPHADAGEVGISAHTDFECITLLYQTAGGLELCDPQGAWHDAAASGRQLTVLFGDMLENWTNGELRATGHRVRITPQQRFSFVLFFAVNDGVIVSPHPVFTGSGRPSRYAPLAQRAHSQQQLAAAERNRDQQSR